MASGSGGGGAGDGHYGDVEYWKKRGKEAFLNSFKNPTLKGTLYDRAKNIPKKMRKSRMMNPQEYDFYINKCHESKGFDVRGCTGVVAGGIFEIRKRNGKNIKKDRYWQLADYFARFAVEQHNCDEDSMLEFVELVRANAQCVSGGLYYLTLRALDKRDGKTKTFRAKVYDGREETELTLFEEAPIHCVEDTTLETEGLAKESELLKRKKVKSKRKKVTSKSRSRAQRPFATFVKNLRDMPILEKQSYSEVVSIASNIWASLSSEEKVRHSATRSSIFEEEVKKKVEELLEHYT